MKILDITFFSMIQLVMSIAYVLIGCAIIFGVIFFRVLPVEYWVVLIMIAIAVKYIVDGIMNFMGAMGTNVSEG